MSIRGRFAQKVVDFVILDDALEVVALVELDDRTHRLEKDAARDAMTAAAGYVTLRYRSREKPEPKAIRAELRAIHAALRT
jgi:very-short-patch-repair endonuclease